MNQLRLLANLYRAPLILVAISIYVQSLDFQGHMLLVTLAEPVYWLSLCALVVAALLIVSASWKMWQASRGMGDLCHQCAMPARYIGDGRYGAYFRCMACGSNRRAFDR